MIRSFYHPFWWLFLFKILSILCFQLFLEFRKEKNLCKFLNLASWFVNLVWECPKIFSVITKSFCRMKKKTCTCNWKHIILFFSQRGQKLLKSHLVFQKTVITNLNATSKWHWFHYDSSYAIYGTFIELENLGTHGAQFARPSEMADLKNYTWGSAA